MGVKVRFFSAVKDYAGVEELELELPKDTTVNELLDLLCRKFNKLKTLFKEIDVIVMGDGNILQENVNISGFKEIAVLPPFSGG